MPFSDFIVYVDESGDHGLVNINPQNPVFVLAFCIFEKQVYAERVVPAVQKLKFEYFGHDAVILHSYEIRNQRNDFRVLNDRQLRERFMGSLNDLVAGTQVTLIASAIDKNRHVRRYTQPADPYAISLTFCVERLQRFLTERGQADRVTHIMVEKRGSTEDDALELAFRRICDGANMTGRMPNLEIRFMDKRHNSTGLQLADLVAYPIARHVVDPNQPNRAYDVLEPKFRRSPAGQIQGYGLKVFP